GKPDLERRYDAADHIVLKREQIRGFAVVAFRPQMVTVARIDELRIDAQSFARSLDASLEDVANTEIASHLLWPCCLVPVAGDRVAVDDEESGNLRQLRYKIVAEALGEVSLALLLAQIGEGQDGHRRLVGDRSATKRQRRVLVRWLPGTPPQPCRGRRRDSQHGRYRSNPPGLPNGRCAERQR